jgi:nucleoid DNA-binding protein
MPKKEIVESVSIALGMAAVEARPIVQRVLDTVLETLAAEGRLELRNFGVFEVQRRAAYKARNPRTGERVDVPEKHVVTFKPGLVMQQRLGHEPQRHSQTPDSASGEPKS